MSHLGFRSKTAFKNQERYSLTKDKEVALRQKELDHLHGPYHNPNLKPGNTTTILCCLQLMPILFAMAEAVKNPPSEPILTRAERRKALQTGQGEDQPNGKTPAHLLLSDAEVMELNTQITTELETDKFDHLSKLLTENPESFSNAFKSAVFRKVASKGKIRILDWLFDNKDKFDIDIFEELPEGHELVGYDALSLATLSGHVDTVEFLLDSAPRFVTEHQKKKINNFVIVAAVNDQIAVLRYLAENYDLDSNALTPEPPMVLVLKIQDKTTRLKAFQNLIDHAGLANSKSSGTPLLVRLVQASFYEEARYLLAKEPDLYATDRAGIQAMEYAYQKADYRMMAMLVEKGYDITRKFTSKLLRNLPNSVYDLAGFIIYHDKLLERDTDIAALRQHKKLRDLANTISERLTSGQPDLSAPANEQTVPLARYVFGGIAIGGAFLFGCLRECGKYRRNVDPVIKAFIDECDARIANLQNIFKFIEEHDIRLNKDYTFTMTINLHKTDVVKFDGYVNGVEYNRLKAILMRALTTIFEYKPIPSTDPYVIKMVLSGIPRAMDKRQEKKFQKDVEKLFDDANRVMEDKSREEVRRPPILRMSVSSTPTPRV